MILALLLLLIFSSSANGWQYWEQPLQTTVKPNEKGIFEFDLRIEHALTMTMYDSDAYSNGAPLGATPIVDYSPDNQSWSQRDPDIRTKCWQNQTILNADDETTKFDQILATVLQWDGKHRKIVTINGKSPGQPIVVPFGAKVVLNVQNRLLTQAITLHVHGMTLRNRWWNDGVPYVQQCPIVPGADYTYRFIADSAGTQWFHGHLMGDRATGLLGGFVVLRPDEKSQFYVQEEADNSDEENSGGREGKMLTVGCQYLAVLQDWNPEHVEDAWLDIEHGRAKWASHHIDSSSNDDCIQPETGGPSPQSPNAFFGYLRNNSILVNQKGWHSQEELRERPSRLPLANFAMKRDENVLFRFVNGAAWESFYIWLEQHDLWVVAADGMYVRPKKVDSLLIHPGERYDVLVQGAVVNGAQLPKPQGGHQQQLFRFVFESHTPFMANISTGEVRRNVGLANLVVRDDDSVESIEKAKKDLQQQSDNDTTDDVDWTHRKCTSDRPCQVLNCPHAQFYTEPRNYTCLRIGQLENDEQEEKEEEQQHHYNIAQVFDKNRRFQEIMLNVHDGLNGWHMQMPKAIPYFHQGNLSEIVQFCDPEKCDRKLNECRCFHHYEFGIGDIVQLTVTTWANMLHPFHVHGTKFYVLKTGFMGDDFALNEELACAKEKDCTELRWKNASYYGGNIPDLNKNNAILRDTIMVPNKGYVVIRFVASNPGWYFAHCHLLYHNMNGMSLAFKVDSAAGLSSVISRPPENFPHNCGHFDGGGDHWDEDDNNEDEMTTTTLPLNRGEAGIGGNFRNIIFCLLIFVVCLYFFVFLI